MRVGPGVMFGRLCCLRRLCEEFCAERSGLLAAVGLQLTEYVLYCADKSCFLSVAARKGVTSSDLRVNGSPTNSRLVSVISVAHLLCTSLDICFRA